MSYPEADARPNPFAVRVAGASKSIALDNGPAVPLEDLSDTRLLQAVKQADDPLELLEGKLRGLAIALGYPLLFVHVPGLDQLIEAF